jgi:crotonobetaine/carnitine-CoA ligase
MTTSRADGSSRAALAGPGRAVVPPAGQTLPALLERQAEAHGDAPLLTIGDVTRSYREVLDLAARSAGTLAAAGIGRGDRVAVLAENRPEVMALVLGCAWLGAVVVPVNAAARGPQLHHVLASSGARVVAVEGALLDVLRTVERPASLEAVWALDDPDGAPPGYAVVAAPREGEPVAAAPVGPGDTLAILYTSGTTGPAKGVCCPHAQFHWWGVHVSDWLGIRAGDVLHTSLPLFHTNALNAFFQALVSGASYVVGPRFSASRFWRCAAEAEADVTYLLGAMVTMLWSRPPGPEDRAHHVRVALAPATPPGLVEPFRERFGVELVEGYGSTETNAVIGPDRSRPPRPGTMGRVVDGFEAQVVDAGDAPVPAGTPGELVLRHREPYAFATGYWGMPEQTVEAWRNLWFHTGDRVVCDADGVFRFVDRLKDAIRRRGENISSFDVEQALVEHPGVAAVAVFPVPSDLGEDEVMAAVVPEDGVVLDPEELVRHCEPRLAYFAIPRFIDVVAELPLTANGKVRKATLRERGVGAATWDRVAAGIEPRRR